MRQYESAYRARNRAARRSASKVYDAAHLKEKKARNRKRYLRLRENGLWKWDWGKRHPERFEELQARWRKENPKRLQHYRSTRARRVRFAPGTHTFQQWVDRIEYYGWKCALQISDNCLVNLTPETVTRDHRIPLSKGGSNWAANLVPACKSCNSKKKDKLL
jgi:5-methylcytosine-specific restriction endonuclease McrA